MSDDQTMDAVRAWANGLAERLELGADRFDIDAVLGVAGAAARAAVRPAAPVTTYLIGVAVGRAGDDPEARAAAFARGLEAVAAIAAEEPAQPAGAAE